MEIGSIVKIKNICFRGGVVDHSLSIGRPCMFLGELNDKMYFMPFTNTKTLKHKVRTIIKPNKQNGLTKASHPNLREIIEKPIAYYEDIGTLTNEEIKKIFIDIKKYYTEIFRDEDIILITLADNYLKEQPVGNYVDDENFSKDENTKK